MKHHKLQSRIIAVDVCQQLLDSGFFRRVVVAKTDQSNNNNNISPAAVAVTTTTTTASVFLDSDLEEYNIVVRHR
jgi:hypothetical protein